MTLQPVSQPKARCTQLATTSLMVLQAAIATTTISAFAAQSVSAQAVSTNPPSAHLFEAKQPETTPLRLTAQALMPPRAAVCWTNATAQDCSYTISTTQRLSLERPNPDQQTTATMVLPPQATTCWASVASPDCLYTISVSPSDRISPYPSQQLSELPNFDVPVNRVILVRIPF